MDGPPRRLHLDDPVLGEGEMGHRQQECYDHAAQRADQAVTMRPSCGASNTNAKGGVDDRLLLVPIAATSRTADNAAMAPSAMEEPHAESSRIVFLFDVDNTLLDNDQVTADLRRHLEQEVGHERQQRYWSLFEELRRELGYADYCGALQRYRAEYPRDPHLLTVSHYLINYPFAERLFPQSLAVIEHVKRWGRPVILSDGDVVFQPRKIEQAGLARAVEGHVLIYIHKEDELEDVEHRYPAEHYVLIDDKPRIVSAIKDRWRDHVTTVFVRQGHYAHEPHVPPPCADLTLEEIGDLLQYDAAALATERRQRRRASSGS